MLLRANELRWAQVVGSWYLLLLIALPCLDKSSCQSMASIPSRILLRCLLAQGAGWCQTAGSTPACAWQGASLLASLTSSPSIITQPRCKQEYASDARSTAATGWPGTYGVQQHHQHHLALQQHSCSQSLIEQLRNMHSSCAAAHGSTASAGEGSDDSISVTFIDKDGTEHTVRAPIGKNFLEVAHDNEIDLEGACEGSLACSTCHLIVEDEAHYKMIPEACEDELDMLDLAFGLTETSRLGCQIVAAKELDGIRVRIPSASRNFYVDGHKPKPH